ncbi:MAG: TMEM165/GDT1 family protein [Gammaproteobacteria bacterium]|nr:TMEM165/GDT1 family protein [Gammaproteobacteria bacterium]MDH4314740.1 TMEM165/GDT1 family protein [Gammaproteobacteria bacterium]MDH5212826.1 TMEM165/GDT1 family protein [Gammaproteobacteria bacterium]MDH5501365.1 TMEM165/GDT1 family protein [Gammaproteobacteria bacterium]
MDFKSFAIVFGTVFLAELGDKTQLATILFATRESAGPLFVFLAASLALVASSAIAVVIGSAISGWMNPRYLAFAAGAGFLIIGFWTIWSAWSQP